MGYGVLCTFSCWEYSGACNICCWISSGDIGVHAWSVSFSYGNAPHSSGVWIASLFAAWHMVFLLLRISIAQGYYGTWESEDGSDGSLCLRRKAEDNERQMTNTPMRHFACVKDFPIYRIDI
jgi:hypothetical protein